MRKLTIADPLLVLALQDEIRRSEEARYDHRLHAVLLVANGKSCTEVGFLLGGSPRAVQYWVNRFDKEGFAGLVDADRPGRPKRLSIGQLKEVESALRLRPEEVGLGCVNWDGKTLAEFLKIRFGVVLCVRQCQRLFKQLGFRLRKPRPVIARADPERQSEHKKNFVL
jgi:transposase